MIKLQKEIRSFCFDKKIHLARRYSNCKYICTQHGTIHIHKANIIFKWRNRLYIIVVQHFSTLVSSASRSSRQKIKDSSDLNYTIGQKDLMDIYRKFYLIAGEYTFFSSAVDIFFRIAYILS